jgi:hypothetical protein
MASRDVPAFPLGRSGITVRQGAPDIEEALGKRRER